MKTVTLGVDLSTVSDGVRALGPPTDISQPRKLTKITPYRDGGFAVLSPYHSERTGLLMKVPVDYSKAGQFAISRRSIAEALVEDRVKLSIHGDGFVQFSGENSGKVISGRDPNTGRPRGFGLHSFPVRDPVRSGPPSA